ncbi:MAG: RNA methyltransferase [Acidobacteria bacterium]|nr:RNA methyltransferase [Acidobacteriota bacterium]
MPRLTVICLGIQGSANLGAIARVMMNFGLEQLHLVQPACRVDAEARQRACHALPILENAEWHDDLDRLIPRLHDLVGTTGKPDITRHGPLLAPPELAEILAGLPEEREIGVLLGPEDTGLGHEQLKKCRWLVSIPTSPAYPSLNIAQAAGILFYELYRHRKAARPSPLPDREPPAAVGDREQFFVQLQEALLDAGFLHRQDPERIMYVLRHILNRAGLNRRELKILRGVVRQLRWALRQTGGEFRK